VIVPRRPAALAAAMLVLVPLALSTASCGAGSGQLTVSITGEHTGTTGYSATDPGSYPHYAPGDQGTFAVHVVNHGPGSVTGVTVHVTLPGAFRYHATTSIKAPGATRTQPLDAAVNTSAPIFGLWTLAPPGSAGAGLDSEVDITFTADAGGDPGGAEVQAYASGDTDVGQTTAAVYKVVVDAAAKISAVVSVSPSTVKRGGTVTYQVRVINGGTGPARDIGVLITLPPVMIFAQSVTPFAGNGTRGKGVDPIKSSLEVFYDGFTLPPLSNAGPGYVVIVFKATILGAGRSSLSTPTPEPSATAGSGGSAPVPSSAASTVPAGTYTVDADLTDAAGDIFNLHAVAPVAVS
jgi:uncharacterized repeat protein (TIGR01451 family)